MATLKSLVNETTNIKNELKTCHTNLKDNLISKGVECSDSDKKSSLIDKVEDIERVKNVTISDNVLFDVSKTSYTTSSYTEDEIYSFYIALNGSLRVSARISSTGTLNSGAKSIFKLVRNGEIIETSNTFSTNSNPLAISYDFKDIKNGDYIKIYAWQTQYTTNINNVKIMGTII